MLLFLTSCVGEISPLPVPADTDLPPVQATLVAEPPVVCEAPEARADAPFDRFTAWDEDMEGDDNHIGLMSGGGVATGDFNGDGVLDLFVTRRTSPHLYLSSGGSWVNADDQLPQIGESSASASVVDIDSDGDLDLFVGRYKLPNTLLLNDGTGRFTLGDLVAIGIIDDRDARTTGQAWADVDGDGDVDLFLSNYGRPSFDADTAILFLNMGDNTFAPHPEPLPDALRTAHTFLGGWHDLDNDGWLDLYGINDFGWEYPNPVYFNDGDGTFTEDSEYSSFLDVRANSMGLGVGDLNRDGWPDLVVPAWNEIAVRISGGDGTWFEAAQALGVVPSRGTQQVSWGSEVADFDNDGDEDIFVAYGYINANPYNPFQQPDALFVQGTNGRFTEDAAAWGIDDPGMSRGVVVADINRDGWVDLLKATKDGPHALQLSRCGEEAWLTVSLRDPVRLNTFGLGAKITVTAGEETWWRRIGSGSTGLAGGQAPEVHFGLGTIDRIDTLEVHWPDQVITRFEQIDPRAAVVITRTE